MPPEFAAHAPAQAKLAFEEKVKLNSRVSSCRWNEQEGKWHVEVTDTRSGAVTHDVCDILINGGGVLNAWKWPDIEGLHDFKGTLLHSANWDTSVDCTGKRVAVIGSGSSGIQIVPKMAEIASRVSSFNRCASSCMRCDRAEGYCSSKSWITPGLCAELSPDGKGAHWRALRPCRVSRCA
jgi:cation diffusion facilitator CzcD-associated flavoprotein CzcO